MPGGPSKALTGKAHVDVAGTPQKKHVAELVLGLGEALMGGHAKPPCRLEHVCFRFGILLHAADQPHDVLRRP